MEGFLYDQNETMELLGYQPAIPLDEGIEGINDIISAYASTEQNVMVLSIMRFFQSGELFDFLKDVYHLGVIAGKREERKRKKKG